ncbi:hypothetical protein GE061_006795 [Apolygus lucorum]|uniref:Uncharacterized protein n=1 Tax=Apolygus lucorum TaxID=248454 RepID=A0A8S9WQ45_APOLU|nr:hypothetical protein GE061_006795 [Apolygus lucorum]
MGSLDEADIAPPAYITKYNKFVDSILDRVNKILRRSYDPVNVRLQTGYEAKKNAPKKNKKKKKKNSSKERKNEASNSTEATLMQTNLVSSTFGTTLEPVNLVAADQSSAEPRKKKPSKAATTPAPTKVKTKPKAPLRARATLYGLSSIQRDGDVTVNVMSSHTTVKTKFLVGPLVLKVEKEFGRGAKKELRSATATTAEMIGKLNLRVMHGGAATLHSIKVLQPRQVRVESPDDHDRTREFVWKRSATIAHLVSQKLLAATKSMLQPPPNSTITTDKPVVTLPATPA